MMLVKVICLLGLCGYSMAAPGPMGGDPVGRLLAMARRDNPCRGRPCVSPVRCVDPVPDEDDCCQTCPTGNNCHLGDMVIPDDITAIHHIGGGSDPCTAYCRCPGSYAYEAHGTETAADCSLTCASGSFSPEEVNELFPEGLPINTRSIHTAVDKALYKRSRLSDTAARARRLFRRA